MAKILETKSIYYNDVNLIAQVGKVKSRLDVPKELHRIIVSPMMAVVGKVFAMKAASLGLTVCLHRFGTKEYQREIYKAIYHDYGNKYNTQNVYCSIGLDDLDRVKYLNEFGVRKWCLDIASGYLPQIKEKLQKIVEITNIDSLIIGNVHTIEGVNYLRKICQNIFNIKNIIYRVGIAGGTPCKTSDIVGVNRGNLTEIMECSSYGDSICADGGISKSSFACKAFAGGAKFIMLGGYWMKTKEAESNLIGDGSYWGGASHRQQIISKGKIVRHSEGKEIPKEEGLQLVSLEELVNELWAGISSYISYSGYSTLTEAIGNGFFEIKQNSLPPKNR